MYVYSDTFGTVAHAMLLVIKWDFQLFYCIHI